MIQDHRINFSSVIRFANFLHRKFIFWIILTFSNNGTYCHPCIIDPNLRHCKIERVSIRHSPRLTNCLHVIHAFCGVHLLRLFGRFRGGGGGHGRHRGGRCGGCRFRGQGCSGSALCSGSGVAASGTGVAAFCSGGTLSSPEAVPCLSSSSSTSSGASGRRSTSAYTGRAIAITRQAVTSSAVSRRAQPVVFFPVLFNLLTRLSRWLDGSTLFHRGSL